jgi:hypothetical protein
VAQVLQGFAKQGRLAGTRRRHEVDGSDTRRSESLSVVVSDSIVLGEQVLEDRDPRVSRLCVARVIPDIVAIGVLIGAAVLALVCMTWKVDMIVRRAVGVDMEPTHD